MTSVAEELPRENESTGQRILRFLGKAPVHVVLVIVGLIWLVPTLGLFFTSLLPRPSSPRPAGGRSSRSRAWRRSRTTNRSSNTEAITSALWTTVLIAIGGTILPIIVAAMAGYAFAWLDFPGRDWLFIVVIALLVVPIQMALIPIFKLYNNLNLYDTILGLILFHTAFGLPFAIFLLRNFFIGIPRT